MLNRKKFSDNQIKAAVKAYDDLEGNFWEKMEAALLAANNGIEKTVTYQKALRSAITDGKSYWWGRNVLGKKEPDEQIKELVTRAVRTFWWGYKDSVESESNPTNEQEIK